MRLLFVGTNPEPGGAASHFVSLTTAMAVAGHEVAAVVVRDGFIWRALARDGLVMLHAADFARKLEPSAMRTVRDAIRALRPDWIIGVYERDYWGTALSASVHRVPLALFLHHTGLRYYSRYVLPWFVRRFFVPSEFLRQWIVRHGVSSRQAHVLYNSVDTQYYRPDAQLRETQRAALGLAADDILVGYIGRLEANKGVVPFAESLTGAMARVPHLHALWVGFGRLEADVDRVIQNSPYAARHTRRPWTEDVLPYYAAMDILALPSAGPEAFGRVLVEAQACGVPVLGSAIGGIGETMRVGTTGRTIAPGDITAWTDGLCDLATHASERQRMGAAGPPFVRSTFDNAVIAETFAGSLRRAAEQ